MLAFAPPLLMLACTRGGARCRVRGVEAACGGVGLVDVPSRDTATATLIIGARPPASPAAPHAAAVVRHMYVSGVGRRKTQCTSRHDEPPSPAAL